MKSIRKLTVGVAISALFVSACASGSKTPADSQTTEQSTAAEQGGRPQSTLADSDLIEVRDSYILGNPDAPVTIVAFSDLQCPFCARAAVTLNELVARHPDDVRVVFKHYPLPFHQQAPDASRAALAAGEQGKFWEMHDVLMANLQSFQGADMLELTAGFAGQLGLDVERFREDFGRAEFTHEIERDIRQGTEFGVRGTPAFFINGLHVTGAQPLQHFEKIVQDELAGIRETLASGTPAAQIYAERTRLNIQAQIAELEREEAEQARAQVVEDGILEVGPSYTLGPEDAPVTIYEFSSLQCPFCARANATLKQLVREYPDQIRIVYKSFPLAFQAHSEPAARAALAAGRQGKFVEMNDLIYENQRRLAEPGLFEELAGTLGLDVAKFLRDLDDPAIAQQVEEEQAMGVKLGIRGTPSFVVNNRLVVGAQPFEVFAEIIEDELDSLD